MKIFQPSFWKIAWLTICLGWILHFPAASQCTANMATRSYDTLITGIGYGNYQLHFPQFNPDSGLLASVKINARVSVTYQFTLKNADIIPSIYSLWVGREDLFTSPVLTSPYDNIMEQKIGVFPLDPGVSVSQGPFSFLNNYNNTDSITGNVAPFLGNGNINFAYSPITYTTLRTNNNSSYAYSAVARDTVHYTVTYFYCRSSVVLASELTHFAAALKDPITQPAPSTVQVTWSVVNEPAGRQYQVQRSRDGQHFTTVGVLTGDGAADYTYDDQLPAAASGNWYYRLQLIDPAGSTFSTIRTVTITENTEGPGLSVYPNPADDFVDLHFAGGMGSGAGWHIELLAVDGSRVQNGNYLSSNNIHINFQHRLPAGVYFIQATDLRGGQRYIKRVVKR